MALSKFREVAGNIVDKSNNSVNWGILESLNDGVTNVFPVEDHSRNTDIIELDTLNNELFNDLDLFSDVLGMSQGLRKEVNRGNEVNIVNGAFSIVLNSLGVIESEGSEISFSEFKGVFSEVHWDPVAGVELSKGENLGLFKTEKDLDDIGFNVASSVVVSGDQSFNVESGLLDDFKRVLVEVSQNSSLDVTIGVSEDSHSEVV